MREKPKYLKSYLTTMHTQIKIQTIMRIRAGLNDDNLLLNRVVIFPGIVIQGVDLRIVELITQSENVTIGDSHVNSMIQCPSFKNNVI